MNRFRQGFHHSFFAFEAYRESGVAEKDDLLKWKEWEEDKVKRETRQEADKVEKAVRASQKEQPRASAYREGEQAWDQDVVVEESDNVAQSTYTDKNQNNISTWTKLASDDKISKKIEKKEVEGDEKLQKELRTQLENLAKNKKIDFPWTNNEWKCSKEEKRLAISSAKVFIELLASSQNNWGNKVEEILDMCRNYSGELDKNTARKWKNDLGINSKESDIQNFYKSFLEYQSRQSRFVHLQGLMWFFFENWIDSIDALKDAMKSKRSKKIEGKEIKERQKQHKEERGTRNKETWNEIARFEIIKERTKDEVDETEKMLALLCDFNFDWEVNSWDVWYRTWTQFAEVFRRELAKQEITKKNAVANLVAYVEGVSDLKMDWVSDVESLYKWMTTAWYNQDEDKNPSSWYDKTKKLQNIIQNSAADFSDILYYGKEAGNKTLDKMMRAEGIESTEAEKLKEAVDKKVKEILESEQKKVEELYPDKEQSSNIMKQLADQLPAALIDKAKNIQKWMAVWARIPLDQIVKWMSVGFHIWIDTKNKKPIFWLFFGRDRTVDLWKGADLSVWANAGLNLWFIPCASVSAEIWEDIKNGRRNKTLDATWVGRISLWWNAWIYGWMFTWWLSTWYEAKKKAWIEKQEKNIHNVIESQAYDWVKELSAHENATGEDLRKMLEKEFWKTSDDELNKAAENLWSIISAFKFDANTTEEDRKIYAKVVADVFTDQWKNNAMIGITNNKWKISWWKLWIQFFAWFVPLGSVVLKFTRYRNARTVESDNSRVRRIDAAVNWTWNNEMPLENGEIWASQVDALNKVLEWYWVQQKLEYIARENKPWKIKIHKSTWRFVDVRISPDLNGYIQSEGEYYLFPANTVYRLLTETGWNKKSAILNIGRTHNTENDIDITNSSQMDNLLWYDELTEWKKFPEWWSYETIPVTYGESTVLELFSDNDVKNALKTIDSADWKAFSKFMWKKRDAKEDFQSQIDALTGILSKNPKLQEILAALQDTNKSDEEKQLIIDRVLAISADANVTSKKILDNLISQRKEHYKDKEMIWPNGKTIFDLLEKDYRSELQNLITDENCKSEIEPSVLWATAFYNRNNTERWLDITWFWITSILWWKTISLGGEDRQKAQEWFLWGEGEWMTWAITKEKSPMEWNNLSDAVTKYINSSLEWNQITLTENKLKALLRWEEVEFALDNSQEKVKIKLDVDYVFYLMWECGNESIGMKLWDLQILRQVDAYRKWQLYLNGVDGTSTIENEEANRAIGGTIWGGAKEEKEPNYDDGSGPSNWKPTTIPWQNEEWWDNKGNNPNNNTWKRWWDGPDHSEDRD